ncbi:MAG: HFX_2341 family transcriptional regulator domain-containing protein [Candidatus Thorarchaeota archaeon]
MEYESLSKDFEGIPMWLELKKRLHIATLGLYRNALVERVIAKRGADKIAIIYTDQNEEDLKRITSEKKAKGIPVISQKVKPWDYKNILSEILTIVSNHEDYDIEFNISCGTRVMTAATYRASLFTDSSVYLMSDPPGQENGEMIEIEPLSDALLTKPKRNILTRLKELGGASESQKDLGTRAELGASSISKHLNSLGAAGYILRDQCGGRTRVELTDLGRIVLNLKTYRRSKIWR